MATKQTLTFPNRHVPNRHVAQGGSIVLTLEETISESIERCLLQMAASECYSVGPKHELLISGHVTTVNITIQILIKLRLTNAHAAATQPTPSECRGGRGGSATGSSGEKHCRSSKAKMAYPP